MGAVHNYGTTRVVQVHGVVDDFNNSEAKDRLKGSRLEAFLKAVTEVSPISKHSLHIIANRLNIEAGTLAIEVLAKGGKLL